jgi:choline-sulfatase
MDSVVHAGIANVSNQLDYDDDVAHHSIRKLRDLARTADERPWMMTASFTHPHDPYIARQQFWDLYDHDSIPMPSVGAIADDENDPHSRRLRHVIAADTTEVSDDQIRNARHAYLANISFVDHHIGEMLDTLDRHGMADNTVVIFTGDHGDMLGERGLWYKMSFFEHSARIPLIVRQPGVAGGERIDEHVGLLDIAPTMLDLAGVDVPATMDGRSVLDGGVDKTVVGEYLGEGAVSPIFMIRRSDWKYVSSLADPPQLFNVAVDPSELSNLAADPEHADVAAAFAAEVADRWDAPAIDAAVRSNQEARATVDRALRQGRFEAWDYVPQSNALNQYMRNHLDLNDVESSRRA